MKIAIDLDDVLGEFMLGFLEWRNAWSGHVWQYDDITDYDLKKCLDETAEDDIFKFYVTDQCANLSIAPGAKEAVEYLASHHELYVVTSRPLTTVSMTRHWIEQSFPEIFKDVVIANQFNKEGHAGESKGKLCRELGCSVLIDDNTHHLENLVSNQIQLILVNKPWNRHHQLPSSVSRANDWEEIITAVNKLAINV